jgi:hypothetical protein
MGKIKNKVIEKMNELAGKTKVTPEEQAAMLMAEAYELKNALNEKVNDAEYDPAVHLARRYKECKTELAEIIVEEKVAVEDSGKGKSIKLGGFKFTSRLQDGRKSLNNEVLIQQLLAEGMAINVINGCIERATKQGSPFWINEIELDK